MALGRTQIIKPMKTQWLLEFYATNCKTFQHLCNFIMIKNMEIKCCLMFMQLEYVLKTFCGKLILLVENHVFNFFHIFLNLF